MGYYLFALCILLIRTATCVEPLPPINLWPAGTTPPGDEHFHCGPEALIQSNYTYTTARRYFNVSNPTITPYLVHNGSGAIVVIAPGGGYGHLAWDDEGLRVARRLNEYGVSALVMKYRVPMRPDAPGAPYASIPLMDAQRAMGLARANAASWGVNTSQVGFMGFSAGGHLTAHISTTFSKRLYPRIDGADDLPCRPDFSVLMYPWRLLLGDNSSATQLAPELVVTKDHPPAMIAQNLDDTTAWPENSLVYQRALLKAGAPTGNVHLYPKGGHGFGVCAELDPIGGFLQCCEWPFHMQRFMQNLGVAPGWPYNITQ